MADDRDWSATLPLLVSVPLADDDVSESPETERREVLFWALIIIRGGDVMRSSGT